MAYSALEKTDLNVGFVPLLDAASLIVAPKLGYYRAAGLNVRLGREANWPMFGT